MPHGPRAGSINALSDSDDLADRILGDKAGNFFGRLVVVQLLSLTVLMAVFSFSRPLRHWLEHSEEHDVCMAKTTVMTCLDWGLNVLLFLVLLPVTVLTVHVRSSTFRWSLWAVWSVTITLDLGLFLTVPRWRVYAVAVSIIMVGFVTVVAVLSHVPRAAELITWSQIYNWAVKVGLFGGLVLVIATQDTSYAYVALAAPLTILFICYCCQLILDSCPPEQAMLGSMFVLFPEGLLLALWVLRQEGAAAEADLAIQEDLHRSREGYGSTA